jgi:hypothetical protein
MTDRYQKIILTVAAAFILVLAGLTAYTISNPYIPPIEEHVSQITLLQQDLEQYISDKLKQERKDAVLQRIVLLPAEQQTGDVVRIPYTLAFGQMVDGEPTSTLVQATAILKKMNETAWRVTQVTTQSETVTFDAEAMIGGGKEKAN